MKKVLFFILALAMSLTLFACGKKDDKTTDLVKDKDWMTPAALVRDYEEHEEKKVSLVKMVYDFKDDDGLAYRGYMTFVLFNDLAPITVDNFVKLASKGFYDNLTITRVVTDTTIQGGDPEKTTLKEKKDSASKIKGEFENNEVFNNLSHRRGVISMARVSGDNDSASSQFFIVTGNFTTCDGDYAAFGYLLEEKNADGTDLSYEQRYYSKEDGRIVLYDYACLDKICKLDIENDTKDGAPTQTVEIKEVKVIKEKVSIKEVE